MFLIGKAVEGQNPSPCRVTYAPWKTALEEAKELVLHPQEASYIWKVSECRETAISTPLRVS